MGKNESKHPINYKLLRNVMTMKILQNLVVDVIY